MANIQLNENRSLSALNAPRVNFIAETGTRGFSLDDVIEHLHNRRKKEMKKYG